MIIPSPRLPRLPSHQVKIVWEGFVMKIIWRNPNGVTPKKISIVNTGRVEAENLVQLFYRYSSGLGVMVTDFELLVNRAGPRQAA